MLILGFADYAPQARRLAACLDLPYREIAVHRFPDGESKVTVPTGLPQHVVVCRSLDHPNDKLIELLLAADAIKNQGTSRITVIAPYLCYMRQDKAFHPGEAVSQAAIGRYLASFCDDIFTVDPHLHRIQQLRQAVPVHNAVSLTATAALADYIYRHWRNPLLIGPDRESEQWVKAVAKCSDLDFAIADKQRMGDHDVRVSLPGATAKDRDVVLVDDVASTARTLVAAAEGIRAGGPRSVNALVTHALFNEHALTLMRNSGIGFVGSTDSVAHPSNIIQLGPILADAMNRLADE